MTEKKEEKLIHQHFRKKMQKRSFVNTGDQQFEQLNP